jgi:hypothetical protein
LPNTTLTPEQMLTLLVATPPRLAALTADLAPVQLRTAPNAGEWSANDVLAHLRACADIWGTCIATILTEDRPTIRAINPRTWIAQTDYRDQDFPSSLHAFATQRGELLAVLNSLPADAWSRAATVTGAGRPLERTVLFYARWLAQHEQPHVKQIARLVATIQPASPLSQPE